MDKPLREQFPRREQSPEEIVLQKQEEERKKREQQNKKIRCPCCKKTQYFDNYLANPKLGTLVCPLCGVLFIDQAKLKIIKKNITEAKQSALLKTR